MINRTGILSFPYIDKALEIAPGKFSWRKILQIGPHSQTFEISLHARQRNGSGIHNAIIGDARNLYDCSSCPFRLSCIKGKAIQNGQLEYKHTQFDKIILLADSGLPINAEVEKALDLLSVGGHIIMFVQYSHPSRSKALDGHCFSIENVLPQINQNKLEIMSISNFTPMCNKEITCLIASKN